MELKPETQCKQMSGQEIAYGTLHVLAFVEAAIKADAISEWQADKVRSFMYKHLTQTFLLKPQNNGESKD